MLQSSLRKFCCNLIKRELPPYFDIILPTQLINILIFFLVSAEYSEQLVLHTSLV